MTGHKLAPSDVCNALVVEPDPLRREGILASLGAERDVRVVGWGSDATDIVWSTSVQRVDVLVLSVDHLKMNSTRSWSVLHIVCPPGTRIVALSRGDDLTLLEILFAAGVVTLCPSDSSPEMVCSAVKSAIKRQVDYHPSLLARLKLSLAFAAPDSSSEFENVSVDRASGNVFRQGELVHLTDREKGVLRLLGIGMTNRGIAHKLEISQRTASFHVSNILRKLEVSSRFEAGTVARMIEFPRP